MKIGLNNIKYRIKKRTKTRYRTFSNNFFEPKISLIKQNILSKKCKKKCKKYICRTSSTFLHSFAFVVLFSV